jgi:hypothetical protein
VAVSVRRRGEDAIAPWCADDPYHISALGSTIPWGVECDEPWGVGGGATKLRLWSCGVVSAVGVTQTATKLTDVTETDEHISSRH